MKRVPILFSLFFAMVIFCFPTTVMAEDNSDTELVIEEENISNEIVPPLKDLSVDDKSAVESESETAEKNQETGVVIKTTPGEQGEKADLESDEELLNGLHKDPSGQTDEIYYYKDGVILDITEIMQIGNDWYNLVHGRVVGNTLAQDEKGMWYIDSDGKIDFTYTGVFEYDSDWWYITDGRADESVNSVLKATVNETEGWWVIREGKVDFTYTGFAENINGWWYCEDGQVQFEVTDVIEGNVNAEHAWWHVVDGKVVFNETVAPNANGWWHIQNGKVNFKSNTIAKNANGWWHIQNGKVNFKSNTVAKNANGWWKIENGKVNFNFTGIATNSNGTWYLRKGKVDFNYTGTVTWKGQKYSVKNGAAKFSVDANMYAKAQKMSSSTKWLILVDTKSCKVGIFKGSKGNWELQKYWSCSPGASSTPTPKGTYTVKSKGLSFGSGYTCWYYTQFYGNYLFHSVLYNPGSKTSLQDGRLGMQLSHGCVRLSLSNAKWIYDNIPRGTKVYIY